VPSRRICRNGMKEGFAIFGSGVYHHFVILDHLLNRRRDERHAQVTEPRQLIFFSRNGWTDGRRTPDSNQRSRPGKEIQLIKGRECRGKKRSKGNWKATGDAQRSTVGTKERGIKCPTTGRYAETRSSAWMGVRKTMKGALRRTWREGDRIVDTRLNIHISVLMISSSPERVNCGHKLRLSR
jgi:hypothetical protein